MYAPADEAKILYVEDEPMMRMLISKLLTCEGFRVRTASNGQEGVQIAGLWQPDLILVDLMMPVMNGYDAAKAIRANPQTAHATILAFSAVEGTNIPDRVTQAGMDGLIRKSSTHAEIVAAVQAALERATMLV